MSAHQFSERFLDDVRSAVTVLAWAERKYKTKKVGSEYALIDNPSVKINPVKNVWNEFGSGGGTGKGGDVFAFERFMTGATFQSAVETVAQALGFKIPGRPGMRAAAPVSEEPPPPTGPEDYESLSPGSGEAPRPIREPTATYDYVDGNGGLVYQAVRMEWIDEDGKKVKTFMQRRKAPDGHWAYGLKSGVYLQSNRDGSWYQATKKKLETWKGAKQDVFESVEHTLYRLDELREELAQDEGDRRVVFICEGEKDCETLRAWGLLSTTNSGGASNWGAHLADEFSRCDVVILLDNDKAGRERGHMIAGSLRAVTRSTRVLDWREHWLNCRDKADVTDWVNEAGGDKEKFFDIVDKLKEWSPQMPESSFGAQRFADIDKPGKELEWLIKGVITRGEVSIWYGAPGSGKSFLITDAALAIARGIPWMGNRVKGGLVVFQAGEGGLGLRRRLRAYRQYNHLPPTAVDDVPFVLLPQRIDIFSGDEDVNKLIAELKAWKSFYDQALELVVIDTLNAAAPGADENSGRDIGPVLNRARKIATETGAHVALIDHTPKDGGTPRGWSGKMGNVDSMIAVSRTDRTHREEIAGQNGRVIDRDVREWKVTKQKDEADKHSVDFILKRIVVGQDGDKEDISSCVIEPCNKFEPGVTAAAQREMPKDWTKILPQNIDLMRALMRAIKDNGRQPPTGVDAPPGVKAVTIGEWQEQMIQAAYGHEEITKTVKERIKKRIQRACASWAPDAVRFIHKSGEFVWRSDRKIWLIDDVPPRRVPPPEEKSILAPGETEADITMYAQDHPRR